MSDLRDQMHRGRRQAPPADEALSRLMDRHDRRRRNGRILSAAVALAVTGAMVTAGFAVLGHRGSAAGPGTTGPQSSGPGTSAPAPGPNLIAGSGQFYYWKIAGIYPEGSGTAEAWFGADGSGRVVRTSDSAPTPKADSWEAGNYPYGDDLSGLSTDPAVLLGQLEARNAPDGRSPQPAVTPLDGQRPDTGGLVRAIGDLLTDAPHLLPEQRQAAYGVLVGLPTAEELGSAVDPGGRPAIGVRIVTTDGATTFYFDPGTHLFMSAKYHFESADPAVSSSTWYVVMESGGIADSTASGPSQDQRFFPDAERLPTASGGQEVAPSPVP
jgi:hypothetical protein